MGIVGLGRMGRFHAAALAGIPEVDLVALIEPQADALDLAAQLAPKAARHVSVADGLAHAGLEAVLVAAPTPKHPEIVAAALDTGLHVLCEKPLALDVAVAQELGALATERGLVLQVGFWRRFAPPWRQAKARIDAGEIGTPIYLRLAQWDADPPPPEFCDPAVSGGLAVDCGVHEFDLAEWLTGRAITQVSAWALPIVDPAVGAAGDVDNLVAVLELDGGAVATVDLSRNARYGDDVRTEVLGSTVLCSSICCRRAGPAWDRRGGCVSSPSRPSTTPWRWGWPTRHGPSPAPCGAKRSTSPVRRPVSGPPTWAERSSRRPRPAARSRSPAPPDPWPHGQRVSGRSGWQPARSRLRAASTSGSYASMGSAHARSSASRLAAHTTPTRLPSLATTPLPESPAVTSAPSSNPGRWCSPSR